MASALVERVDELWLSRSWTTRPIRPGEAEDAYVFVDDATFLEKVRTGGFIEHATFLGHRYGTPLPSAPPGCDVLLEIDVQGAEQIRAIDPGATVILLLPPSMEIQRQRLVGRGDLPDAVARRIETGKAEVVRGARIADFELVNDDLERCVQACAGIVEAVRLTRKDPHGA